MIVTLVATRSYPSLMLAVPLLILAEIAIPDERTRLLAFGVIVAAVFAAAMECGSASCRFRFPRSGKRQLALPHSKALCYKTNNARQ